MAELEAAEQEFGTQEKFKEKVEKVKRDHALKMEEMKIRHEATIAANKQVVSLKQAQVEDTHRQQMKQKDEAAKFKLEDKLEEARETLQTKEEAWALRFKNMKQTSEE